MDKHPGSCLCRQVTFEIHGAFDAFFFCHCSRCRKATGTAHAANLFATSAELVWLSGEDQIRLFKVPETRFVKSFCNTCGGALPCLNGGRLLVPAGSLDKDPGTKPTAHIFVSSKADWDKDLETVVKFAQRPH